MCTRVLIQPVVWPLLLIVMAVLQLILGQYCISGPCQNEAVCEDTLIGYECFCVDGYAGQNCDINFDDCASAPCKNDAKCTDEVASFVCACPSGFTGMLCEEDIDECLSQPCTQNGTCINIVNGYICQCPEPFKGDKCDQLPCDTVPCENSAVCRNDVAFNESTSGYFCECLQGFTGRRCETNIDDCGNENDTYCHGNGLCVDGIDEYSCLCEPGWVGVFCEFPDNECLENYCRNNASCIDKHLGYTCVCQNGYEGALCERERDECSFYKPCQNGASCIDLFNEYRCTCSQGWHGENCTEQVNECRSSPCKNGATCLDLLAGFVCSCAPFYTGQLCEQQYNPCGPEHNPCRNGANCVVPPDGKYRCFCTTGYTGLHCEVDVNECLSSPCENNSTCEDVISGYICYCMLGWTGQDCEQNVDDCVNNQCQNGAECIDLLNGYECNCTEEYTGRLCEEMHDFCESDPCFHGSTCIGFLGDYECLCSPLYTGKQCEDLIDGCSSDPCENNGTCLNTLEGVVCNCLHPYSGATCSNLINYCASAPCLNGGTCNRLSDGFICVCPQFLTGKQCTDLIDYCSNEPCKNGAYCINDASRYRCSCLYGFKGENCTDMVDFCTETPCQNNANCSNIPGGFKCLCIRGFTGELCESLQVITSSSSASSFKQIYFYTSFTATHSIEFSQITQTHIPPLITSLSSAFYISFNTIYTDIMSSSQTHTLSSVMFSSNLSTYLIATSMTATNDLYLDSVFVNTGSFRSETAHIDVSLLHTSFAPASSSDSLSSLVVFTVQSKSTFSHTHIIEFTSLSTDSMTLATKTNKFVTSVSVFARSTTENLHPSSEMFASNVYSSTRSTTMDLHPSNVSSSTRITTISLHPNYVSSYTRSTTMNLHPSSEIFATKVFLSHTSTTTDRHLSSEMFATNVSSSTKSTTLDLNSSSEIFASNVSYSTKSTTMELYPSYVSSSTRITTISLHPNNVSSYTRSTTMDLQPSSEIFATKVFVSHTSTTTDIHLSSEMFATNVSLSTRITTISLHPNYVSSYTRSTTVDLHSSSEIFATKVFLSHTSTTTDIHLSSEMFATNVSSSTKSTTLDLNSSPEIFASNVYSSTKSTTMELYPSYVSLSTRITTMSLHPNYVSSYTRNTTMDLHSSSEIFATKVFLSHTSTTTDVHLSSEMFATNVSSSTKSTTLDLNSSSEIFASNVYSSTKSTTMELYPSYVSLSTRITTISLHPNYVSSYTRNTTMDLHSSSEIFASKLSSFHANSTSESQELQQSLYFFTSGRSVTTSTYSIQLHSYSTDFSSSIHSSFITLYVSNSDNVDTFKTYTDKKTSQILSTFSSSSVSMNSFNHLSSKHTSTDESVSSSSHTFLKSSIYYSSYYLNFSSNVIVSEVGIGSISKLVTDHSSVDQNFVTTTFDVPFTSFYATSSLPTSPLFVQYTSTKYLSSSSILTTKETDVASKWHSTSAVFESEYVIETDLPTNSFIPINTNSGYLTISSNGSKQVQLKSTSLYSYDTNVYNNSIKSSPSLHFPSAVLLDTSSFKTTNRSSLSRDSVVFSTDAVTLFATSNLSTYLSTFLYTPMYHSTIQSTASITSHYSDTTVSGLQSSVLKHSFAQSASVYDKQHQTMIPYSITFSSIVTHVSTESVPTEHTATEGNVFETIIFISSLANLQTSYLSEKQVPYSLSSELQASYPTQTLSSLYTEVSIQESIKSPSLSTKLRGHITEHTFTSDNIKVTSINEYQKSTSLQLMFISTSSVMPSYFASSSRSSLTTPTPTAPCGFIECKNDGNCQEDRLGTYCICDHMYTGLSCEIDTSSCSDIVCDNGGYCTVVLDTYDSRVPRCNCPMPYAGSFCTTELLLHFPSFLGFSFLEFPPPRFSSNQLNEIYISVKTTQSDGTILYTANTDTDNIYSSYIRLHLIDGKPVYEFSCDGIVSETIETDRQINTGDIYELTIRQVWSDSPGRWCSASLELNSRVYVSQALLSLGEPAPLGKLYIGGFPRHDRRSDNGSTIHILQGFIGCIRNLQVNQQEFDLVSMATKSANIDNCNVPVCQHSPCKNGGTCHSVGDDWYCSCPYGYGGTFCERKLCDHDPCLHGGTCIILEEKQDRLCLCPFGMGGLFCEEAVTITTPQYSGTQFGHTSYTAYANPFYIEDRLEIEFAMIVDKDALESHLILYVGDTGNHADGGDFMTVGLFRGYVVFMFDLGSGYSEIYSQSQIDLSISNHHVQLGRTGNKGWLKVDNQRNVSSNSRGPLTALNTKSLLYVGGYPNDVAVLLPKQAKFKDGFIGCIHQLKVRSSGSEFVRPGSPPDHVEEGRNIRQCSDLTCQKDPCHNGAECVDVGAAIYCNCSGEWKGALCLDQTTVCDVNNACADGSTCVPTLPSGYRCVCPIGKHGSFCDEANRISDPAFMFEDSYMGFEPVHIRQSVKLVIQIKPNKLQGILFYTAQRLHSNAGDFLAIALHDGKVQLRYDVGSGVNVVDNPTVLNIDQWHTIQFGRNSTYGYVRVDDHLTLGMAIGKMSYLDTTSDFFLGGIPHLSDLSPRATESEPSNFNGCVRELTVNDRVYDLTENGAKHGQNIDDCDGTACGYRVCQNGGTCSSGIDRDNFTCACTELFFGKHCEIPIQCQGHQCYHGNCRAVAQDRHACDCFMGWSGSSCDEEHQIGTSVRLGSTSYILLTDKLYDTRDKNHTFLSFSFKTRTQSGLLVWHGQTYTEDEDYLGIGLQDGHVKLVWNLGWYSSNGVITTSRYNDDVWYTVSVEIESQHLKLTIDGATYSSSVSGDFRDLDTGGIYHLGNLKEMAVKEATFGFFLGPFEGCIKDFSFHRSEDITFDHADEDVPMANSADPDERAPVRALSSGSTLFACTAYVVISTLRVSFISSSI